MNHKMAAIAGAQFGEAIALQLEELREAGLCPLCMIAGIMAVLAPQFLDPAEDDEKVLDWLESIAATVMLNWKKGGAETPPVAPDKRTMN